MTESQYATGATPGLRCDTKLALGRIKMPISVDSLAASAFQYCPSLTSVDLGSVTTIGNRTFRNCPSLVSVDLGSVTTIGDDAFYNCSSLNSVTYTAPGTLGDTSLVLVDQDGDIQGGGDT